MDRKGREGTYNFFLTTGGRRWAEHRAAAPPPCHPADAAYDDDTSILIVDSCPQGICKIMTGWDIRG